MTDEKNTNPPRPAVLCILDGWGWREETENNAWALAETPNLDRLFKTCPHALIDTAGEAVGLPAGQMGNSEVGHMNLGSGRVVLQDLPKIDTAIADGTLPSNDVLNSFVSEINNSGGACHLMGLVSPGGVHSHQDHLVALARVLSQAGVPVVVHAFMDGRDTPPESGLGFMETFAAALNGLDGVSIGTVSGRFYAMDRDKRWDRVERAYRAIVHADGAKASDPVGAIQTSYDNDVTDEFVVPTVIDGFAGMADGDGLLMANFRADRAREILTALVDPAFDGFERGPVVDFAAVAGMVEYSSALNEFLPALFPAENVQDTLGEVVSRAGRRQLRIAETEKYAHVTFFFNGGEEAVFENEDRILVPSPKVATYDLQPEMSADEVTDRLVEAVGSGQYDLIVCNYANPDMVGHTGILSAAIKAMETIDRCVGRLDAALDNAGGVLLLTADHGNLEMMVDPDSGAPHTAHTVGDVPVLLSGAAQGIGLKDGVLADVAPTLLALMGIEQPAAMTGHVLLGQGFRSDAITRRERAQETRAQA